MLDTVALLQQKISGHQVLRIIVPYLLQRTILPVLRFSACCKSVGDLNIGIILFRVAENKVTFQITDPPDAHAATLAFGVKIYQIFQHGSVVDAIVRIIAEIEAQIGKIVFFLSMKRTFGFHIKTVAGIQDFCIQKHLDIVRDGSAGDRHAAFDQRLVQAVDAHCCAEVVDNKTPHRLKSFFVSDFDTPADILFKNLGDNALRIASFIGQIVDLNRRS